MATVMRQFLDNSYLYGANASFIEDLYEKYLVNPQSVAEAWREYFDRIQVLPGNAAKDVAHAPVVESFVQPGQDVLAKSAAGVTRHLLPQYRFRVHVHQRARAAAVDPGAHRADARHAGVPARAEKAPAAEAHRGGAARALSAYPLRRPEALLAGGRREPDPV